ncbi:MAG: ribonuclease R [Clostridia bacterium]|nr:ribonuclease R [Clostridia bacterium]
MVKGKEGKDFKGKGKSNYGKKPTRERKEELGTPLYDGKLFVGKIMAHTRGFAFCQIENDEIEDVFIAPPKLNGAFNNDKVEIQVYEGRDGESHEGRVVNILERGTNIVVGNFMAIKGGGFVSPDNRKFNKDIYIPQNKINNAMNQDKVVVKILDYGDYTKNPSGEIIEVIGDMSNKGDDIIAIIRNYELYQEFPITVSEVARKVPQKVTEKDLVGRVDLRDVLTCTIDGEDSRDFDDAISIERLENGNFKLGVHIADVGHYVKRGSPIDIEAFNRGTSVYFPDMVLPMIPKELSNGICSLNPNVDRLTLSVIAELDKKGEVVDYKICESVINSNERMTYNDVYAILQGDEELTKKYAHIKDSFFLMAELNEILEKNRKDRGALDFEIPEAYIKVDENGRTCDIVQRERNTAHRLIESFMVLANEIVAKHFDMLKIPFVYRVHDKPTIEKMADFLSFISGVGIKVSVKPEQVTSKALQQITKLAEEKEISKTVNEVMLRSMQKALYETNCRGHFGLGARFYCHFTSPIRRYPDLTINRIIKLSINNKLDEHEIARLQEFVHESAVRSSEREKLAEKAEREVDAFKKAEYMQAFVGCQYDATITGATANGIFVGLANTCEGFVSISNLPDDIYNYNEKTFTLRGQRNVFMLGKPVKVELIAVNLEERKLDFKYIEKFDNEE